MVPDMPAPLPQEPPARPRLWTPEPDLALALDCGVLSPDLVEGRPAEARARLRSKTWRSYGGVIVMHNGPLTVEQSEWVALLRSGPGAVLAAASAMARVGVKVDPPPRPQVVIPWWRPRLSVAGVDVRRSRVMSATEVHPTRQPPQFRLARATVDAASLARRPDDVRALLCAPIQQRRLLPGQLRSSVSRLGPVSGRALMMRTLDDLELGAQSVHELRFTRGLRRGGLPSPDRQVWRQHPDGRRYLDCEWEAYALHVEIDGLAHRLVTQWVDDLDRSNELEIAGSARRLRIVGFLLFEQEAHVVDQVRRALVAGGWRP
jgi:very-short-patch-repair endonuclease